MANMSKQLDKQQMTYLILCDLNCIRMMIYKLLDCKTGDLFSLKTMGNEGTPLVDDACSNPLHQWCSTCSP